MPDLSNVGPDSPRHDTANCSLGYAILGSYYILILALGALFPYLQHLNLRKLRHSVIGALGVFDALFLDCVSHILGMCPKKQVLQITARRIVACVANLKTPLKRATNKNPQQAMHPENFTPKSNASIPSWVSVTAPLQAFVGCRNELGPDIFDELRFGKSNHSGSPLAVLAHSHGEFVNHFRMLCRNTIRLN